MPSGSTVIATRQSIETLYSNTKPLASGAKVVSNPVEISGFNQTIASLFADQSFSLMVEEGNGKDGPWTPVLSLSSAFDGSLYRIATRLQPVGGFMRVTLQNSTISQKFMSAMIYGLPL